MSGSAPPPKRIVAPRCEVCQAYACFGVEPPASFAPAWRCRAHVWADFLPADRAQAQQRPDAPAPGVQPPGPPPDSAPPEIQVRRANRAAAWPVLKRKRAMARGFWTEERVAALRRCYRQGLSAAQIGRELGCTKLAVIGKADRLGLTESSPRRTHKRCVGRDPLPRGGRTQVRVPPPPAPELLHLVGGLYVRDAHIGVGFGALQRLQCRWPLSGAGAQMRCCGQPVADDGGPWFCPSHRAQAAAKPPPAPHELARQSRALVGLADRAGRARPDAAPECERDLAELFEPPARAGAAREGRRG